MKNENRYSGWYFYIPFSVFKLGKGKRKIDYPILIFHYGIGEWKTKGRYIQHVVVFLLSCFHLAIEKNENGYNGSYFYFSFFVWGLEKKKRMLSYPFSIFYYEIEKRKTKGRYIHGPIIWINKGKFTCNTHSYRTWDNFITIRPATIWSRICWANYCTRCCRIFMKFTATDGNINTTLSATYQVDVLEIFSMRWI